jgi:hypothetical protein
LEGIAKAAKKPPVWSWILSTKVNPVIAGEIKKIAAAIFFICDLIYSLT